MRSVVDQMARCTRIAEDRARACARAMQIPRMCKYPPAEPGALGCEPLKAAESGALTRPQVGAT
jgi:hypothetical protein